MRIERILSLEAAREAWEALEGRAGRVYSTWSWADAWWRQFGAGCELELHSVHHDGGLAALLPLYRTRRGPIALLRLIGHGVADEMGPVCAPTDAPLAAEALRTVLRSELPLHGLALVDRLFGADPVADHVRGATVRTEASPVLWREGRDWESWLASRSANLRQQLRRRERRLRQDYGLRYRLTSDPAQLDADLSTLIRLHHMRWIGGGSAAFSACREAFHRDFAHRALARGWLRLWLAEVHDRPVAAYYGFRFGATEWYYQAGRDPAWDGTAVGQVLLAHSIRAALQDGVESYRFGVGDEPYKSRFASADPGLRTLAVGRPAVQAAAESAARVARALPLSVKERIARRAA
jgi:CelD/BcsL family acetyltransferase involved in cellulose biosynthesis